MISRLFKRKQQDKQVVWGIRTPISVRSRWTLLSLVMRVPTNRLILFVLNDWARQNAETLLDDQARNQLADKITQAYLNKQL